MAKLTYDDFNEAKAAILRQEVEVCGTRRITQEPLDVRQAQQDSGLTPSVRLRAPGDFATQNPTAFLPASTAATKAHPGDVHDHSGMRGR